MKGLLDIRKNFVPRINIRWEFKLRLRNTDSKIDKSIESEYFPASSVSYSKYNVVQESLTIAPNLSININSGLSPVNSITVSFYETDRRKIHDFLKSYYTIDNKLQNGRASSFNPGLELCIIQYKLDLNEEFREEYYAEPADAYALSLNTDAMAQTGELKFNILGTLNDPEFSE